MQLFLSISGIILSVILLYFNARNNRSTIYLGSFFLLAGLFGFAHFVLFHLESEILAAGTLVHCDILPLFIGPSLYFYIRSVLKDDPALRKRDFWHFLPVLLYLIIASPYLLAPWTFKLNAAGTFIRSLKNHEILNSSFLGNDFLVYFVFILPTVLVLGYVLWSAILLIRFLRQDKEKAVFLKQQSTIKWIKAFLVIELLLVPGYLLFMIKIFVMGDLRGFTSFNAVGNILGIGPVAILILTFFSPGILYGLPRIPEKTNSPQHPDKTADPEIPAEKAAQNQLETGYLLSIGREADECMEKFRPYTNTEFNLVGLSVLIHIPVHHLSYYFREVKKESFTDYRNKWRVTHAKKLMLEGKTGEMTLEAIGLLSGFPNRDSFRTAFQRVEGVSPAAFLTRTELLK